MESKRRGKGAAPKRRPGVSPRRVEAGAAPLLSSLLSIDEFAALLRTKKGCEALQAIVGHKLFTGDLTRDESIAQLGVARMLRDRKAELLELERDQSDLDRAANVAQVKEAIAGKKGSALRADMAVVPPMERLDS